MNVSTEMVQLLHEVGLMAAWRGDTVDARTILEGLQTSRPESALPAIGLAVAYMNEGRYDAAKEVLESALQKDADCDTARTHLALACKLSGSEDRSRSLCKQVMDAGREKVSVELASTLLDIPAGATSVPSTPA